MQHYDFSISGGNAVARYFTLVSFYNQGGLLNDTETPDYNSNTNFKRFNFRSNVDVTVTENFDISANIAGRAEIRREPGQNSGGSGVSTVLSSVFQTPPNAFPLINPDGSLGGTSVFQVNPLGLLQQGGYNDQLTRVLLADINGKYKLEKLVKGLSINTKFSIDMAGNYTYGRTQAYEVYSRDTVSGVYSRFGTKSPLAYRSASFDGNTRYTEFCGGLDFDRSFSSHTLDISIRYTNRNIKESALIESTRNDASARLSYNFKQSYFIDFVASYSGHPYFAPGHRYGLFPAISAAWIISDAEFFKSVSAISYLKLRSSYGITGYDAYFGPRRYPEQYLFGGGSGISWAFGTSFSTSSIHGEDSRLFNKFYTFEKVKKFDVGFDSKFFNQSLTLNFDYFSERRTGISTNNYLPSIIGNGLFPVNAGETEYKGFELMLDYTKTLNEVTLSLFTNYTFAKSNIIKINDTPGIPDYQLQAGHPVGSLGLLYQAAGIFQTQPDVDNAPVQLLASSVKPGDIQYKDINNDGKIDSYDQVR